MPWRYAWEFRSGGQARANYRRLCHSHRRRRRRCQHSRDTKFVERRGYTYSRRRPIPAALTEFIGLSRRARLFNLFSALDVRRRRTNEPKDGSTEKEESWTARVKRDYTLLLPVLQLAPP